MTRTLRELLTTADGALRGRSLALGALLSWALAGCLVTENTDFRGSMSQPRAIRLSPGYLTSIPFVSDSFCANEVRGEKAMRFVAVIRFDDVESQLYARLVVNGAISQTVELLPNGTDMRELTSSLQCVPYSAMQQPCNSVELITSSQFNKLNDDSRPAEGELDRDFASIQWLVYGTSEAQPGASRDDCAALLRDGGV